jgi:ankyrin repeat protein
MPSSELEKFFDEIRDLPEYVGLGEAFAGPSTRGLFGDTPLHVAATRGDARIIALLLDAGAEIDARGEYGHTPLHEAVGQGHIEAAKLLLSRGADTGVRNDWGQTAKEKAQIGGKREIEVLFSDVV